MIQRVQNGVWNGGARGHAPNQAFPINSIVRMVHICFTVEVLEYPKADLLRSHSRAAPCLYLAY